jgi:hypothetical protein
MKHHSGPSGAEDDTIVDMELRCTRCGQKLYLPAAIARDVVRTVQSSGIAILICVCGQAQALRRKPRD